MKTINYEMCKKVNRTAVEDYDEPRRQYVKRKTEEGFIILAPADNELFIDIDGEGEWINFWDKACRLIEEYGDVDIFVKESNSGLPHRHIRIHLPFNVTDYQRIAFQAALGSDGTKELISIFRTMEDEDFPCLLATKGLGGWEKITWKDLRKFLELEAPSIADLLD